MTKKHFVTILLGCLLCLLFDLAGCCVNIGGCSQAKYERTDALVAELEPGSTVIVETHFGSVTVTGGDVTDCRVTAEIRVHAPTEQEAAEIAEQVTVRLVGSGKTLTVDIEKPDLSCNQSVSVSFDITVPNQTNLECDTSYGAIKFANVDGNVSGKTSFASIECENIRGSIYLDTSYGSITCRNITSPELTAKSSFGAIDIVCSASTPSEIIANASTSYGSINFGAPVGFSGQVDLATSFGSIKTNLPVTVKGPLSKERIRGTVGSGKGKLALKTSFGSITIK